MANFELSKFITVGRYVPRDSLFHRLDPRVKLVCFVLWVIGVSAMSSVVIQLVFLLLMLVMFRFAKLPIGYGTSGVRPVLPALVIVLIFEILFVRSTTSSTVLFSWGWIQISTVSLTLAFISLTKFLGIVWLVSLLTLTTSLSNLTHALGRLLSPLERIKVPVQDLVMMLTVALRFVPLLAEEAERMMKAQAARGAEFGTARWWQIVRRTRSVFPILIPLFVGALHRGETLVMAMEVRGYRPGRPRSSYVSISGGKQDAWALVLSLVVLIVAGLCDWAWRWP